MVSYKSLHPVNDYRYTDIRSVIQLPDSIADRMLHDFIHNWEDGYWLKSVTGNRRNET